MRAWARPLAVAGDLGFLAAVAATYKGMRLVMVENGGYCASGGPYTIAAGHQCSGSATTWVLAGMVGIFLVGTAALCATTAAGWSPLTTGLAGWAVLFGALGFNFISLGFDPPHRSGASGGWIVTGIVFWLMALGGAVPAAADAVDWLRRGGKPEPPVASTFKVVRAAVNQDRSPRTGGV
jgi:hypothetical protein